MNLVLSGPRQAWMWSRQQGYTGEGCGQGGL